MNVSREGRLVLDDCRWVHDSSDRRVSEGDVLFNNTNSPALVGKTALVRGGPFGFSNHMTRLRPDEASVDATFLAMQLHFMWSCGFFESFCSNHVNQASVSTRRLLDVDVVLPGLGKQRRIVEVLEDHLSRLDAGLRSGTDGSQRLKALEAATLHRLVGDARATTLRLSDVTRRSGYGTSTKCVPLGRGVPVARIPNIVNGQIDMTDEKRVQDVSVDVRGLMLGTGDVLFVRTNGSRQLIGRTAVVQEGVEAAFASYLIRFQLNTDAVLPEWVHIVMESPAMRRQLEARAASSAGQYNLSLSRLQDLEVPVPTMPEQIVAVAGYRNFAQQCTRLRSELTGVTDRAAALRRALLAAAFSGRLTGVRDTSELIEEMAGV
jgi:type I restriction enzyme S subunit